MKSLAEGVGGKTSSKKKKNFHSNMSLFWLELLLVCLVLASPPWTDTDFLMKIVTKEVVSEKGSPTAGVFQAEVAHPCKYHLAAMGATGRAGWVQHLHGPTRCEGRGVPPKILRSEVFLRGSCAGASPCHARGVPVPGDVVPCRLVQLQNHHQTRPGDAKAAGKETPNSKLF